MADTMDWLGPVVGAAVVGGLAMRMMDRMDSRPSRRRVYPQRKSARPLTIQQAATQDRLFRNRRNILGGY